LQNQQLNYVFKNLLHFEIISEEFLLHTYCKTLILLLGEICINFRQGNHIYFTLNLL